MISIAAPPPIEIYLWSTPTRVSQQKVRQWWISRSFDSRRSFATLRNSSLAEAVYLSIYRRTKPGTGPSAKKTVTPLRARAHRALIDRPAEIDDWLETYFIEARLA